MIFNLIFLLGVIIYTIYGYFKGSARSIINLVVGIISLIVAALCNNYVAMLLSKYVTYIDLNETMSVLLGSEYVYFKAIAFLLVYTLLAVILTKFFARFESIESINFENKIMRVNFSLLVSLFHMTILMNVALATPYAVKYSNGLSSTIANVPGVGTVMNEVVYEFNEFNDILEKNPALTSDEINIIVMKEMIKDGYGSKKSFRSVLSKSDWYTDDVDKWLKK